MLEELQRKPSTDRKIGIASLPASERTAARRVIGLRLDGRSYRVVMQDTTTIGEAHQHTEELRAHFHELFAKLARNPDVQTFADLDVIEELPQAPGKSSRAEGQRRRGTTARADVPTFGEPAPWSERPRWIVGVDVGCESRIREQRRKTIVLIAERIDRSRYSIAISAQVKPLREHLSGRASAPGYAIPELRECLIGRDNYLVAMDFPFALARSQLDSVDVAALAGESRAMGSWSAYAKLVHGSLSFGADVVSWGRVARWRSNTAAMTVNGERVALWVNRETEKPIRGAPPLKTVRPCTFNMTLAGAWLLHELASAGCSIDPLLVRGEARRRCIEIYPSGTLSTLGFAGSPKRHPREAIELLKTTLERFAIELEIAQDVEAFVLEHNSGSGKDPDHDGADAFCALVTGILYAEARATKSGGPEAEAAELREGAIWIPRMN